MKGSQIVSKVLRCGNCGTNWEAEVQDDRKLLNGFTDKKDK